MKKNVAMYSSKFLIKVYYNELMVNHLSQLINKTEIHIVFYFFRILLVPDRVAKYHCFSLKLDLSKKYQKIIHDYM